MSVILDTDLLTVLQEKSQPAYARLQVRLAPISPGEIFTTIVTFQEQTKGRLAYLNQARKPAQIILGYQRLDGTLQYFRTANVVLFDQTAQDRLDQLRAQRVHIGTMDLRIASIALVTGSTLLSRNLRDFRKVPGLDVQDWTQ